MEFKLTIGVTPQLEKVLATLLSFTGNKNTEMPLPDKMPDKVVYLDGAQVAQVVAHQQPAPIQQAPVQQPVAQAVPVAPVQPVQQAPVQQMPQQPQTVPTSAPTYDMNQLAVAATQLMDAGKQPQLLELLASFGAQSLMQLPKEQYGAFATKLRELGAKI